MLVRGGPWRIGIRHPRRRDRLAAALMVSRRARSPPPGSTSAARTSSTRAAVLCPRRAVGDGDRAVARGCGRLRHRRLRHGGGRAVVGARSLSGVRGSRWGPCAHDGGRARCGCRWRPLRPASLSRLGSAGRSRLGDSGRVDGVVHQHLARQDLARDPVALRDEVLLAARQRDDDPVGQVEPGVLAHRVERVDEVEQAAFAAQVVVELSVERDADPAVLGDRPALDMRCARRGSPRRARAARRPTRSAAVVELLERRPAAARRAPRGSFVPRRGPSRRRFGSSCTATVGPSSKPTSLTRSSSAISSACARAAAPRRARTGGAAAGAA